MIKRFTILFMILMGGIFLKVQGQVAISRNGSNPHPDAMLDIQDTTKALIIPRIALRSIIQSTPMNSFVAGMVIYNTATSGSGVNAVTPGLYYCDGTKWIKASAQGSATSDSSIYNTDGFLNGTRNVYLNNHNLILNSTGGNLLFNSTNGRVGIGTQTPNGTLHVNGSVYIDSLQSGSLTDSVVTIDRVSGRLRMISPSALKSSGAVVKKVSYVVSSNGQTNFATPLSISSEDSVQLFRNGVFIKFSVPTPGGNTIVSEVPCAVNDEILIIQIN